MYRWLLGHENYLSLSDLSYIVPEVYKTLSQLHQLVLEKRLILVDNSITDEQKTDKVFFSTLLSKYFTYKNTLIFFSRLEK